MTSFQSKLFSVFLQLIYKKNFLKWQLKSGRFQQLSCRKPPPALYKVLRISHYSLHGHRVFTLQPKPEKESSHIHILYLHGGAYVQSFALPHWNFMRQLVQHTGCTITAPDYPLAPDHTYRESFGMMEALYKQLMAGIKPENLVLMGDSPEAAWPCLGAELKQDIHR